MAAVERPLFGFAMPSPVSSAHTLILACTAYINTIATVSFQWCNTAAKVAGRGVRYRVRHQRERQSGLAIISQVVFARACDKGVADRARTDGSQAVSELEGETKSTARPRRLPSEGGGG